MATGARWRRESEVTGFRTGEEAGGQTATGTIAMTFSECMSMSRRACWRTTEGEGRAWASKWLQAAMRSGGFERGERGKVVGGVVLS